MSQIAGMNLHYMNYSLEYFLNSMTKLEIENIELWGGAPHLYSPMVTLNQIKDVRGEINRRNLNVICYTPEQCMYPFNLAAKEQDLRKKSIEYFIRNIHIAAELGTDKMLVTSGKGFYHEPREEAWLRSKDSLEKLTREAEKVDIQLVLEPLQPFESNLVTNVQTVKQMIQEIQSPHFKGNFDTVAMAVAGDSVEDYFRQLKTDLVHIHLIDGNPSGHLAWGDGSLPLKSYLEDIKKFNYEGYITLEIAASDYYLDPENTLKKSIETIKKTITDVNKEHSFG